MKLLRAVIFLLVLANIGFYAWTRGAFIAFGSAPARLTETEPQRVNQQIRPEILNIRRD